MRDCVVVRPDNVVIQSVHSPHNREKLSQGTGLKIAPGPDSPDLRNPSAAAHAPVSGDDDDDAARNWQEKKKRVHAFQLQNATTNTKPIPDYSRRGYSLAWN